MTKLEEFEVKEKLIKSSLLGAIIGDIVGSRFEFNNHRSKDFRLFDSNCYFTDDTIMSIGIANVNAYIKKNINDKDFNFDHNEIVDMYKCSLTQSCMPYADDYNASFGDMFRTWLKDRDKKPYHSYGNGCLSRIGSCFDMYGKDDAKELSDVYHLTFAATAVTHDSKEALDINFIFTKMLYSIIKNPKKYKHYINNSMKEFDKKGFKLKFANNIESDAISLIDNNVFSLDDLSKLNIFDETCFYTFPIAMKCVYEATGFEDAIRNAISIGGDSDTIAAIVGIVAAKIFGIPSNFVSVAVSYLNHEMLEDLFNVILCMENK